MTTLYLCGAGNVEGVRLALRVNDRYCRWQRLVVLDDNPELHGRAIMGVPVAGPFDMLADADPGSAEVVNLVARTTANRSRARQRLREFGVPFTGLIDPSVDPRGSTFGTDILAFHNATLGTHSAVAEGVAVFMGAVVGHGSTVGPCCVLAPNAVINARVTLGEGVYVGTNGTVLPDVTVGAGATIGANSVAVQDIPPGATVLGVPGRVVMTNGAKRSTPAVAAQEV